MQSTSSYSTDCKSKKRKSLVFYFKNRKWRVGTREEEYSYNCYGRRQNRNEATLRRFSQLSQQLQFPKLPRRKPSTPSQARKCLRRAYR